MRRLSSAADARAYLEQQAEGGLVLPLEEGWEWLTTYRQRTQGLPFLQLLADDLAHALARGELEYVGVVFSPPQAEVPEGLLIWGTLAAPGGRLSLAELAIAPLAAPGEQLLTAAALRRVRVSAILARANAELASRADLAELARRLGWEEAPDEQEVARLAEVARRASEGLPRRGRPPLGDDHYARIARSYLRLQEDGIGRGILLALAEEERRPRETVRDWVASARRRGFLTPGQRGRAGALPGPRLPDYPE